MSLVKFDKPFHVDTTLLLNTAKECVRAGKHIEAIRICDDYVEFCEEHKHTIEPEILLYIAECYLNKLTTVAPKEAKESKESKEAHNAIEVPYFAKFSEVLKENVNWQLYVESFNANKLNRILLPSISHHTILSLIKSRHENSVKDVYTVILYSIYFKKLEALGLMPDFEFLQMMRKDLTEEEFTPFASNVIRILYCYFEDSYQNGELIQDDKVKEYMQWLDSLPTFGFNAYVVAVVLQDNKPIRHWGLLNNTNQSIIRETSWDHIARCLTDEAYFKVFHEKKNLILTTLVFFYDAIPHSFTYSLAKIMFAYYEPSRLVDDILKNTRFHPPIQKSNVFMALLHEPRRGNIFLAFAEKPITEMHLSWLKERIDSLIKICKKSRYSGLVPLIEFKCHQIFNNPSLKLETRFSDLINCLIDFFHTATPMGVYYTRFYRHEKKPDDSHFYQAICFTLRDIHCEFLSKQSLDARIQACAEKLPPRFRKELKPMDHKAVIPAESKQFKPMDCMAIVPAESKRLTS